jgi:hypothetical protein
MTTVHSEVVVNSAAAAAAHGAPGTFDGVLALLRHDDEPRGARAVPADVVDLRVLRRRARRAYDRLREVRLDDAGALEQAWAEIALIDDAVRHAGVPGA